MSEPPGRPRPAGQRVVALVLIVGLVLLLMSSAIFTWLA